MGFGMKTGGSKAAKFKGAGTIQTIFNTAQIVGDKAVFDVPLPKTYALLYNGQTYANKKFTEILPNIIQFPFVIDTLDKVDFMTWRFIPD